MKIASHRLNAALIAALASPVTLAVATFEEVASAQTAQPAPAAPPAPPPSTGPAAPSLEGGNAGAPGAGEGGPAVLRKDEARAANPDEEKKETRLPFRNSTLLFDQSMSTQTAHLETSPQLSYVPVYEWWISFRPRYYFTDELFVSGRFDYYKEFTNSEQTTKYREDVFGDIWANLVYQKKLTGISKYTKASLGARFLFPTSKASQNQGVYVHTGATASISQGIPIKGESAPALSDAHVALALWYDHPFSRATTGVNGSLDYVRQDTGGRSFLSDQLSGGLLTNHQLVASIDTGLQITPKLSATLDMIFINQWRYRPTAVTVDVPNSVAPYTVGTSPNDTNYLVSTWFIASVDYDVIDELTLTLGYYNLANQLAPDGTRRGVIGGDTVWWSPDARVFFDVTANLDKIYDWASGAKTSAPKAPPKGFARLPSSFATSSGL